jgi:hypothetical protein
MLWASALSLWRNLMIILWLYSILNVSLTYLNIQDGKIIMESTAELKPIRSVWLSKKSILWRWSPVKLEVWNSACEAGACTYGSDDSVATDCRSAFTVNKLESIYFESNNVIFWVEHQYLFILSIINWFIFWLLNTILSVLWSLLESQAKMWNHRDENPKPSSVPRSNSVHIFTAELIGNSWKIWRK